MPKPTSAADAPALRVTLVTLDGHLAGAADRAFAQLQRSTPGISCSMHCAGEWGSSPESLEACISDIGEAHIVIVCMLFMEEHIQPVLPALAARREECDAMLCFMSAGEVMKLTRIGGFSMDGPQRGPLALLRRLRGGNRKKAASSGAGQMAMLRRLPRILRFIPGKAQDVRAYFLGMQYWLAGSDENIRNLIALMVSRYASGEREVFRGRVAAGDPVEYPETGVYHPALEQRVAADASGLPKIQGEPAGTVGLFQPAQGVGGRQDARAQARPMGQTVQPGVVADQQVHGARMQCAEQAQVGLVDFTAYRHEACSQVALGRQRKVR